jgi:hypothetical protein
MSTTVQPIDDLCINTIRTLSIDGVQKANSGHPGMPLGAAPMAYVLWTRHLRHNPTNPKWPDRDRFVLSAGHASMLIYSLLFLTGYDLNMEAAPQGIPSMVWCPEWKLRRVRWVKVLGTRWDWQSRSAGWPPHSIGRTTKW